MLQLGNHDHRTQVTKLVIYTASLVGNIFPESIATKNRQRLVCLLRPIYTARLCRMRQAYDRPTTWLKSRKRVVGLIYTKQFVS